MTGVGIRIKLVRLVNVSADTNLEWKSKPKTPQDLFT